MRIGFRLFMGFGLLLLLFVALVAVGWEGNRRLTEARDMLERRAVLEADMRSMQAHALAFMLDPASESLNAVLARSGALDQTFSVIKMHVAHDMVVRLDKAMRANIEFRGTMEGWQAAADARVARVNEAEAAAQEFTGLFEELAAKERDAAFVHPDGYASAELVNNRLAELRLVNDIQRDFYQARLLSRDWMRGGDDATMEEIRTLMGSAMGALTEIKSRMSALADKDMADTLLAHGRDYLAALSDLEDSTIALNDVRRTLASAVTDMREPMKLIADRYQADMDYIQDIGLLTVGGILALAFVIALLFGLIISGGVRKRLNRIREALDALAAGGRPERDSASLGGDMGLIMDAVQRVAMAQAEMAEKALQLAKGQLDAEYAPRSEHDLLGAALAEVAETERALRTVLERNAQGEYGVNITPRSGADALMLALRAQNGFVAGRVVAARQAATALRDIAGKAMDSLKLLEQRLAASGAAGSAAGAGPALRELAEMAPRIQAACTGMRECERDVQHVAQDILRLRDAMEQLGDTFKQLMGRASFSEDVARQVEALAINVNIEAARSGDSTGLDAIEKELRAVVTRCRENAADVNESLYVGRRASDDVAARMTEIVASVERLAKAMQTGLAIPEADLVQLRTLATSTPVRGAAAFPQAADAELQRLASGLGKLFAGIVMELNTLKGALEPFQTGSAQAAAVTPSSAPVSAASGAAQSTAHIQQAESRARTMPLLRMGRGREDFEEMEGE